jgi:CheY-like chemotaxis protein/anti-sigma regulatory factor (Ser/Thr protein kinase)
MSHVLIVEDSRTQALQIRFLLEDAGFEVTVAGNGREALSVLARQVPDVVLTDLEMPEMNGLKLVEAARKDYPALPVILMTAMGSEEIAVQALQKGAASYVPKRVLNQDIVATLHQVLLVAQLSREEERVLGCLTHADFRFVLDNDVAMIAPLIVHLQENLGRIQQCDRHERMRIGVALHESLTNAIHHGNLQVDSQLRQGDDDEKAFRDLIAARRTQSPYAERRVHFRAALSPTESVYTVKDEGPGFDPRTLPDPTDPHILERVGGRGLVLIRTFMDRVEHNENGNQITMTKYRHGE